MTQILKSGHWSFDDNKDLCFSCDSDAVAMYIKRVYHLNIYTEIFTE